MRFARLFALSVQVCVLVLISVAAFGAERVLLSEDGVSQISVPDGWQEQQELNDVAVIQAADTTEEKYIIVITDSKEDFEQMSLEKHSEITRENLLKSLTSPTAEGPERLTINGLPAVQYEVRGSINNLKIVYIHTTIETPSHYHQVLTWTLRSKYDKNREALMEVVKSFRPAAKASVK